MIGRRSFGGQGDRPVHDGDPICSRRPQSVRPHALRSGRPCPARPPASSPACCSAFCARDQHSARLRLRWLASAVAARARQVCAAVLFVAAIGDSRLPYRRSRSRVPRRGGGLRPRPPRAAGRRPASARRSPTRLRAKTGKNVGLYAVNYPARRLGRRQRRQRHEQAHPVHGGQLPEHPAGARRLLAGRGGRPTCVRRGHPICNSASAIRCPPASSATSPRSRCSATASAVSFGPGIGDVQPALRRQDHRVVQRWTTRSAIRHRSRAPLPTNWNPTTWQAAYIGSGLVNSGRTIRCGQASSVSVAMLDGVNRHCGRYRRSPHSRLIAPAVPMPRRRLPMASAASCPPVEVIFARGRLESPGAGRSATPSSARCEHRRARTSASTR